MSTGSGVAHMSGERTQYRLVSCKGSQLAAQQCYCTSYIADQQVKLLMFAENEKEKEDKTLCKKVVLCVQSCE